MACPQSPNGLSPISTQSPISRLVPNLAQSPCPFRPKTWPVPILFGTGFARGNQAIYGKCINLRSGRSRRIMRCMAKKRKLKDSDVTGLKYFDKLEPLLRRLHDDGCQRDRAGNRQLHYDQYCMLILLYLFNPIVTSLRGIQQASELKKVQRKLGCPRTSLGSLSEASTVFDPERLKEIICELGDQLQEISHDSRLQDIQQTITLVDGTLIAACLESWKPRGGKRTQVVVWSNGDCILISRWLARFPHAWT